MLLGLLLGDVRNPGEDRLRSGPASQQVCWILDALIRHELQFRAVQRAAGSGAETVVREAPIEQLRMALLRWGALNRSWPRKDLLDGWLVDVPALASHGESTPAEDNALAGLEAGQFLASGQDRGATAMLRALPLAASAVTACPELMAGWCAGSAGLTHGHPEAWSTAALLGVIAGFHLTEVFGAGPWVALDALAAVRWFVRDLPNDPLLQRLGPALDEATSWSPAHLADLSGDETSAAVLAGALYLFRHCRRCTLAEVRHRAEAAADASGVAALTGALIGLERGTGALDVAELSRHELTWPLDSLARDYCLTLWSPPAYSDEMDTLEEMSRRYPVRIDEPPD